MWPGRGKSQPLCVVCCPRDPAIAEDGQHVISFPHWANSMLLQSMCKSLKLPTKEEIGSVYDKDSAMLSSTQYDEYGETG